jgi:hypothetical protein
LLSYPVKETRNTCYGCVVFDGSTRQTPGEVRSGTVAVQPRSDRAASTASRRLVDAGRSAKGICSTDAALTSGSAWRLHEHAPDLAAPRNLHQEPKLPSDHRIATRQLLSIPPICLYPITCLDRYQRGRHNLALNAHLCELPVHDVARRPRLITSSQLLCRAKLPDHLANRLSTVRNRSQAPDFTIRLCNGYGDRLGMDLQT